MLFRSVWTFNAYEDRIDIEESVYLAGNEGPRRTTQIVIHGRARKVARVQWTLSLTAASPVGLARRSQPATTEKPAVKAEAKTEAKSTEKGGEKTEQKPEQKVEHKAEPKVEQKNEPNSEPKTEQKTESKDG